MPSRELKPGPTDLPSTAPRHSTVKGRLRASHLLTRPDWGTSPVSGLSMVCTGDAFWLTPAVSWLFPLSFPPRTLVSRASNLSQRAAGERGRLGTLRRRWEQERGLHSQHRSQQLGVRGAARSCRSTGAEAWAQQEEFTVLSFLSLPLPSVLYYQPRHLNSPRASPIMARKEKEEWPRQEEERTEGNRNKRCWRQGRRSPDHEPVPRGWTYVRKVERWATAGRGLSDGPEEYRMENSQDNLFRLLMKATVTNGDWNSYFPMLRYFLSEGKRSILF